MKKILCLIIVATLLFTTTDTAFAKKKNVEKNNQKYTSQQQKYDKDATKQKYDDKCTSEQKKDKDTTKQKDDEKSKQDFKINESPVIKYGNFKLPINPVKKGMGAKVTFNKTTAVLTVIKDTVTIVFNFKKETVTVNGVVDTNAGIFSSKNDKKTTVLIKYIANVLGLRVLVDDDEVSVEVPGLSLPTNVTVTPVGTIVKANTLNNTILYMTSTAKIIAGQATGGKAELYVGSKLVATDTLIEATDTTVSFTSSDNTPTNAELQAAIPVGGVVKVKLYNAYNNAVTSAVANPTLVVDYIAPTITSITASSYNAVNGQLSLTATGAGAIGDMVDVTKISFYDYTLGRTYQLTNTTGTGSTGVVKSANSIVITIGSADKIGLTGFGSTTGYLTIAVGSFLKDVAGNSSASFSTIQIVSLTVALPELLSPTKVTVTPVGTKDVANTLNSTTLYMTAAANITAGQATGGRAELYVGSKLVATDSFITSTDTTVTFTTSDYTPTNAELQAVIPAGGLVTVKLYNTNNHYVTSTVANPTLIVDYVAPTITGITSAIYNVAGNQLYLVVTGVSATGDKVDVTKIALYDSTLGRNYRFTNTSGGSNGVVNSANSLVINIGSVDKLGLTGFGTTTVYLLVSYGSLLTDAVGNSSSGFSEVQTIPVTLIK